MKFKEDYCLGMYNGKIYGEVGGQKMNIEIYDGKKQRNIDSVIHQILKVVPKTEPELKKRLEWHLNDAYYKAPELQGECWYQLAISLAELIGVPKKKWQIKISSIMGNKSTSE